MEEKAFETGKTRRDVKRLANKRARWRRIIDALCSRKRNSK
jgi:hypothetical protein